MERYHYIGYGGCESMCGVSRHGDTIVLTELDDNPGTSITNAVTIIATDLAEQYGIQPDKLRIIERYPADSRKAGDAEYAFSLANLVVDSHYFNGRTVAYSCASYSHLTEDEAFALTS